ncbi:MAG: hypothetical protein WBB33_01280 [Candidatus Saccharimonadales bacterium]
MDTSNSKSLIVDKIKNSTTILLTVSRDPSVDALAAALSFSLMLNKLDKRATAVFSGAIPPAITFLEPEKNFEGTVDSLRDFIIALNKEKADRLRYKVEGDVVRIYITPYKTDLSEKDLEFSYGDFNVDLVIALGVDRQDDLDGAISAHGRILHDATVATINNRDVKSSLGTIDWSDGRASSLCEMLMSLSEALGSNLLDEQIATGLLTGIVSSTDRFSNAKTTPRVMTMSAQLMAAGAHQQLIAEQLEKNITTDSEVELPPVAGGQVDSKELKIDNSDHESIVPDKPIPKANSVSGLTYKFVNTSVEPTNNKSEFSSLDTDNSTATQSGESPVDRSPVINENDLPGHSNDDRLPGPTEKIASQVPQLSDDNLPASDQTLAPSEATTTSSNWRVSATKKPASSEPVGGALNATISEAEDRRRDDDERAKKSSIIYGSKIPVINPLPTEPIPGQSIPLTATTTEEPTATSLDTAMSYEATPLDSAGHPVDDQTLEAARKELDNLFVDQPGNYGTVVSQESSASQPVDPSVGQPGVLQSDQAPSEPTDVATSDLDNLIAAQLQPAQSIKTLDNLPMPPVAPPIPDFPSMPPLTPLPAVAAIDPVDKYRNTVNLNIPPEQRNKGFGNPNSRYVPPAGTTTPPAPGQFRIPGQ